MQAARQAWAMMNRMSSGVDFCPGGRAPARTVASALQPIQIMMSASQTMMTR